MRPMWLLPFVLLGIVARVPGAQGEVIVMEGDTSAEIYVNGVYVRKYTALPIVPMNNMRKELAFGNPIQVYRTTLTIMAGDVIGIKVTSNRSIIQPMIDPLGRTKNFSGYSGVIAAVSDGMMTSNEWKCSQDHEEPLEIKDDYIPWHSKLFKDDAWPQAVEQDPDCCPWRDQGEAWGKLHAKWISAPWGTNYSNARLFYCRYHVPVTGPLHPQELSTAEGGRLPYPERKMSTLFYSQAMGCQVGYTLVDQGCFRYDSEALVFADARAVCLASGVGGDLAKIDSEAQNAWIVEQTAGERPLLGLTDAAVERTWVNVYDGKVANFTAWNITALEPSGGVTQNCAAVLYDSGKWGDVACNSTEEVSGFICRSEACRDFTGVWMTDLEGYVPENLTQVGCFGSGPGGAYTYAVVATRITTSTGREGTMEFFKDEEHLVWDDGDVWFRYRAAPTITISVLDVSDSSALIYYTVPRRTQVSCGIVDARYSLRAPTAMELEDWGKMAPADPTTPQYVQLEGGVTANDFEVTLLDTLDAPIVELCEEACMARYPACVLMSWYVSGSDLATGMNCRLASAFDENKTIVSSNGEFVHKAIYMMPIVYTMTLPGSLIPGSVYHAYCRTRDPWTQVHSKLSDIDESKATARADGAMDSGGLDTPTVIVLGGFASTTEIIPVVQSSSEGRMFCAARPVAEATTNWTSAGIKAQGYFNILIISNASVPVTIGGLEPQTEYEVACFADAEGGKESSPSDIQLTRRRWFTEKLRPPISAMFVTHVLQALPTLKSVRTIITVDAIGYLWCYVVRTDLVLTFGVPREATIRSDGLVQKVEDLRLDAYGEFKDLRANISYEIYCTAEENDFSNETNASSMRAPYPIAEILRHEVAEDSITLFVAVDRGPASVYCRAFEWARLPTGRSPTSPTYPSGDEFLQAPAVGGSSFQVQMYTSPFKFDVPQSSGGVAKFVLAPLASGSLFDVYCYAEEQQDPVPLGAEAPPRMGMTAEAIRKTLLRVKTYGPIYEDSGWHCVAGRPCNITALRGEKLNSRDRVLVRADPCPGRCRCSGQEDLLRKGAFCSDVSQMLNVSMPFPGQEPDRHDPLGEWCYVEPGTCVDERPSQHFPALVLSYRVCSYNLPVGRAGSGPAGFPSGGVGLPLDPKLTLAFAMTFRDLDYPRLAHFPPWIGSFEVNIRQSFLAALGSRFLSEHISFDYLMSQNFAEVFVYVTVIIPASASADEAQALMQTAIHDWLPADVVRRLLKINLIRNAYLGPDHTITLANVSDPTIVRTPVLGTAFGWGKDPIVAPGYGYNLCFCNGTATNCTNERDFRLGIGRLHMSGPTKAQTDSVSTCVGGLPCYLDAFKHYAAANGSRLVVLPDSPDGCRWKRRSPGDAPGVPGFPLQGVSEPAGNHGDHYAWAGVPLVVVAGVYNLCWCGPPVPYTRPFRELDVPYADGGFLESCPPTRGDNGVGFLAPAGKLRVTGPDYMDLSKCSIGLECVVSGVTGVGLRGGDRVTALRTCGEAPPESDRMRWTTTTAPPDVVDGSGETTTTTPIPAELAKWIYPGWLELGKQMPAELLDSIGIGGETGRGMWGFPNNGYSLSSARVGYYSWGGALWAEAGDYQLCWCSAGDGSIGTSLGSVGTHPYCSRPEDYKVPFGTLRITGPAVQPSASQVFQCARRRPCEISGFQGTMPTGSKLLIAEGECGGPAYPNSPNSGQSYPSADGARFKWGLEPVQMTPGVYRLCWCADIVVCYLPEHFGAFAGLLRVKAPLSDSPLRYCPLDRECNITGVTGLGLHNGDKIAALTVCGAGSFASSVFAREGVSIATFDLGSSFTLPPASKHGHFRLCWCPGEQLCSRGEDFDTDLGALIIGGPDPAAEYVCYEWQPCRIEALRGWMLRDGDGLFLVPLGTSCAESAARAAENDTEAIPGFPLGGVSLPATGDGYTYSWGDALVRAIPGQYYMCYCGAEMHPEGCSLEDYITAAGSLRIGTSKEYLYVTRPEDNEPRSIDPIYAIILGCALPMLFAVALGIGWWRRKGNLGGAAKPEPEAPPIVMFLWDRSRYEQRRREIMGATRRQMKKFRQLAEVVYTYSAQKGVRIWLKTKDACTQLRILIYAALNIPIGDNRNAKDSDSEDEEDDEEEDHSFQRELSVGHPQQVVQQVHPVSVDSDIALSADTTGAVALPGAVNDPAPSAEPKPKKKKKKKEKAKIEVDPNQPPPPPLHLDDWNWRRCDVVLELMDASD